LKKKHKQTVRKATSKNFVVKNKVNKVNKIKNDKPSLFDLYNPLEGKQLQIMDENGKIINPELMPKFSNAELKKIYYGLVYTRMADEKTLKMQRSGVIGTFAQVKGQEGCQIGAMLAIKNSDWVVPSFREMAAFFWKGGKLRDFLLYYGGNEIGNKIPKNMNFMPVSIPVGSQTTHAVGISWAHKMQKKNNVTITFFGDGGTSQGECHEAMTFAGVFKTPTIFFCQNNQYAISTRREDQCAAKTLAQKANGYGFKGIQIDGNDLFASYVATKEASRIAKSNNGNGGPSFIEAYTYRMGAHTTADDPTLYRSSKEVQEWLKKDPILRFSRYMESLGIWSKSYESKIVSQVTKEIEREVKEFMKFPKPSLMDMFAYQYDKMSKQHEEQLLYLEEVTKERGPLHHQ